ncbi:hypothetical protein GLW05_15415 [Pontibacillus yanchengensis]|uniref:Uncharacterized protein n=1 Tax=Pontibacillus yanchengensis TaxID=462910 RepID=A0A6I5A2L9_9BACI|nr:hypothetical protein [Pontibacillus yanchengensis]MYL34972.1 hypothetical protein [Pontibacillus yanchengensis]
MEIKFLTAIISALVAVFIAVLNHFIVTPYKEAKERKRNRLKSLYAPLYGLINVRTYIIKEFIISKKKLMLGGVDTAEYYSKEYMETFILENSGYASNKLLNAWIEYVTQDIGDYEEERTKNLVITTVKEYNQLKKDLKYPYNQKELETGIPECIKEVRDFIN